MDFVMPKIGRRMQSIHLPDTLDKQAQKEDLKIGPFYLLLDYHNII